MSKIKKSKLEWPYNLMEKVFDDNLNGINLCCDIEGCIEYYHNNHADSYSRFEYIIKRFKDNKSANMIADELKISEPQCVNLDNANSIRYHIKHGLDKMKSHKRLFEVGVDVYKQELLDKFLDTKLKNYYPIARYYRHMGGINLDYTMRELSLFSRDDLLTRSGLYKSCIDSIEKHLGFEGIKLPKKNKKIKELRDLFLNETSYNLLISNGITSIESLLEYSAVDLKRLFGSSYSIIPDIEEKLHYCNLSLSKNNKIITSIPDIKNWNSSDVLDNLIKLHNIMQNDIVSVSGWRVYKSNNICFRININQYRRLNNITGSKYSSIEVYYINNNISIIGYYGDSLENTNIENIDITNVRNILISMINE